VTGDRIVHGGDDEPGIRRRGHARVSYVDERARHGRVSDAATLDRIARLAIPPAWTDVWISMRDRHAQVTGRTIHLRFRGKSAKTCEVAWTDPRLSHLMQRCRDIPGQLLFQWVADELGNTPAVCRASYVHPIVLETFSTGQLAGLWPKRAPRGPTDLLPEERRLLRVLEHGADQPIRAGNRSSVERPETRVKDQLEDTRHEVGEAVERFTTKRQVRR
jgi:DNA topoisomerase IB